jgi:PAS domain S-box-containing protein
MRSFPHGAVFTFDTDLRYLSAGGLGLADVGLSRELLEGKTIYEVFPAETSGLIEQLHRAALSGESTTTDIPYEGRLYAQRLAPVRDPAGEIVAAMGFMQDITKKRADEQELRDSVERFQHIFAYAPIGKAIVELDGRWRQVNQALTELTGYSEAELLAGTFQDITHPDDLDADLQHVQSLVAGDIPGYEMEKRYITATGATVWVLLSVTLVRDENETPLYFIAQILDISQRKAQEQALQDLVAMLSHDLLTPITVAVGYAELLDTSWADLADDRRAELLHKISAAGKAAQAMLRDTLTVSSISGQGIAPRPEHVEVQDVVRAALDTADASDVFETDLRPGTAVVDPTQLSQMVSNLVGNAIKYGQAPFRVSLDEREAAITLRVSDSGSGVPAEFVPQLFDRFSRSEAARTGTARGTGLGLYITRELVSANGGTIWYEDTPGGGATFAVDLLRHT